jgi:hypothetical protein
MALAASAPVWIWGATFGFIGLAQTGGLALRCGWMRRLGSIAGAGAWAFALCGIFFTDWRYVSAVTYTISVLANAWIYLRLSRDERERRWRGQR